MLPITFAASDHEKKAIKHSGWLADLRNLPNKKEIESLSKHVDSVMGHEKDEVCAAINPRLRKMIFLHFATYQHVINQRDIYLEDERLHHWAHVFGMLLQESSGDTTSITSMTGRSYSTYEAKSDLKRWGEIAKLSKTGRIPLNYQTNFGLAQLSVDRLFVALHFKYEPVYLTGEKQAQLNTAIAARRLIWFYQDFAEGRLTQEHDRIHHHAQDNPKYTTRFTSGIDMALLLCGTRYMFNEGYGNQAGGASDLAKAMASIAYCPLGSAHEGYGLNEANAKCFADWVTLCPTLNFDIAMLTPLSYFATRDASPVCLSTFKALLNKKPLHHQSASKHIKPIQHEKIKPGSRLKKALDAVSTALDNLFSGFKSEPHKPKQ